MRTQTENLSNFLIAPIEVHALAINKKDFVSEVNEAITGYKSYRQSLDFDNISRFRSPEAEPLVDCDEPFTPGIYVKWTLPPGLRHSQHTGDQQNFDFPYTPNRWLVMRRACCESKIFEQCWVIQSDAVNQADNKRTHFDKENQPCTLGRVDKLGDWLKQQETPVTQLFLHAMNTKHPLFASYQPFHPNIFSYQDTLEDLPVDKPMEMSYTVIGWYSSPTAFELDKIQEIATLNEFLVKYGFEKIPLTDNTNLPKQLVCQGMILEIQWNGSTAKPILPTIDPSMSYVIGTTPAEALSVYFEKTAFEISAEQTQAIMTSQLNALDEIDGDIKIADAAHAQEFSVRSASGPYSITSSHAQNQSQPDDIQQKFSPELIDNLARLNAVEAAKDQTQRELSHRRWELYALWYKYRIDNALGPKYMTNEKSATQASIEAIKKLALKAQQLESQSTSIKRLLEQAINKLELELNHGKPPVNKCLTLIRESSKTFTVARDPIVILTDMASPWERQMSSNLPVRTNFGMLDTIALTPDHSKSVNVSDFQLTTLLDNTELDLLKKKVTFDVCHLIKEFAALDPVNIEQIKLVSKGAINDTSMLHQCIENTQNKPFYATDQWKQPWLPLFCDWSISWVPEPFVDCQFDGTDYHLPDTPSTAQTAFYYKGRSLLIPHAAAMFKGELMRLIEQDPHFNEKFGQECEQLRKRLADFDPLSFHLHGLNQQFVHREDSTVSFPLIPNKTNSPPLAASIDTEMRYPPIPGNFSVGHGAPFQPIRAGRFNFEQLVVIDSFGQAVNLISRESDRTKASHSSESSAMQPQFFNALQSTAKGNDTPTYHMQLKPRLMQPSQLFIQWNLPEKKLNPILGWILPIQANKSVGCFSPEGNYYGQIILTYQNNVPACRWEVSPSSRDDNYSQLAAVNKTMFNFIDTFLHAGNESTVAKFSALLMSTNKMDFTKEHQHQPYAKYQVFSVGRPFALATLSAALILERPAYQDQSWEATPLPRVTPDWIKQSFPIQLGDTHLKNDGLVGFYPDDSLTTYVSDFNDNAAAASYAVNQSDHRISLSPQEPGMITCKNPIVLMDACAKVTVRMLFS